MSEATLYKQDSSEAGKVTLNDAVFGAKVNPTLLHEAVVNHQANYRRGTASTKTRGNVRGGGIKPWKQKGTGRARQGSIRAVQWRGGGIAFGPLPRDYSYRMPQKARKAALRSALSDAQANGRLIVLDNFALSAVKTKDAVAFLKGFKVDQEKVVLVSDKLEDTVKKSMRNIAKAWYCSASELSPYCVLWADKLFVTQGALAKIEEALSK